MSTELNQPATELAQPVATPDVPEGDFFDLVAEAEASEPERTDEQPAANASEEAGDATAVEQVGGEGAEAKPDEVKAASEGTEAKPQEAATAEPSATTEEKAQDSATAKRGFWDHYLSTQPIAEIIDHLKKQSASRYDEMRREMVKRELADADQLFSTVAKDDPETYGKALLTAYEGDKAFWRKRVIADNPDIKAALEGGAKGGDGNTDAFQLTDDLEEDLRLLLPEAADSIIERLKAAPAASETTKPAETAKSTDTQAPDAKAPDAPSTDSDTSQKVFVENLEAGYAEVHNYLDAKARDPKELGLQITDDERQKAPDVVDAKEDKLFALFNPYRGLPDFERGLFDFAKDREIAGVKFMDAFREWQHFSRAGEKQNAIAAAKKFIPFADRYLTERLQHPIIQAIDRRIEQAVKASKQQPKTETFVPGRTASDSQATAKDPESAFFEEALNYGP